MTGHIILREAEEELRDAARFYDSRATGLGLDFISEVEKAIQSVKDAPESWPIIEGKVRRRLLSRFPFGILYYIDENQVIIVAIAHLRRKPGYWRRRLKKD
ncbi:MAG: type II toxin-antitoxin system RelE/ParE family toxin [Candidatus Sigynarchaeota archaeon]